MNKSNTIKSEDAIQHECYIWFHNNYPRLRGLLFSVPNGGARSALQGKIFKMTGVVPGVADMLLMFDSKTYCIEMKNNYGTQSDHQKKWEKTVTTHGFDYYLIRDLESFKALIEKIIPSVWKKKTI